MRSRAVPQNLKSQVIKTSDLKLSIGDFTYAKSKFRASIRATCPDYDEDDPKTWPLITQNCIGEGILAEHCVSMLLGHSTRFAYDKDTRMI